MKKRMIEYIKSQMELFEFHERIFNTDADPESYNIMSRTACEISRMIYILNGRSFSGIDDIDRIKVFVKEL